MKKRNNPFTHRSLSDIEPARFPTLTPWVWEMGQFNPSLEKLDFTQLAERPHVFRPMLSGLWMLYVDCIPQKTPSYLKRIRVYILRFAKYLNEHPNTEISNINSLSALTREILIDFRAWADKNYPSATAHDLYMLIKRVLILLQSEKSPVPGCLSADLEIPTRTLKPKRYDTTSTQPYSRDEEVAITSACKQEMNEVLNRLTEGKKLLALGRDPRLPVQGPRPRRHNQTFTEDWHNKANVVWYAKNVLNGRLPSWKHPSEPYSKFYLNPRPQMPFIKSVEPFELLYPQVPDLIPFIILLSLKTGLNAESILSLKRGCIIGVQGDKSLVEYKKSRGTHETMTRTFSNKGALSPIGIIKTVLHMTDCLVQLADDDAKNQLWLAFVVARYSVDGYISRIEAIKLRFFYPYANGYGTRKGFVQKHNLKDQHGKFLNFKFKEARVTHGTNAYLKKGNLEWVSQKKMKHHGRQGLNTTALHYVANDATRHIHEQTVRNVQDGLVNEVRHRVIADDVPAVNPTRTTVDALSESENKLTTVLSGAQDVFIAQCRDFYNQPGGKPNTPCSDPWQCFGCANALWTSRILPRLFKFLWFMEEQSKLLSMEDWERKFSFPFAAITKDILPRFQTRTIEWAKAEAKDLPFYVSPHLKEI